MPRGIPELKRRNAASRERYHRRKTLDAYGRYLIANEVRHLFKTDLLTGETTEINRSQFEREIQWFLTFSRWNCYAGHSSVAWEEMSKGAKFYSESAVYWIEIIQPRDFSFQAGEIDAIYANV